MNPIAFTIATLSGILTGAFVLGMVVPLLSAGDKARRAASANDEAPQDGRVVEVLIDLWLVLLDSLPIFTIVRAARGIRELPAAARAMKAKWSEDRLVRQCFRMAAVSFVVFAASLTVLMVTWR